MKNIKNTSWSLIGAALLFGGSSLLAADMTIQSNANGLQSLGGYYTGPYQGTINGVSTAIICDDFAAETYFGEVWTANVSTLSNLSQTKFGNQGLTKYEEAAWLAQQLTTNSCLPSCAPDIQFALWNIFDSSALGALTGNDYNVALGWFDQATSASQIKTYNLAEFSNVSIYTATSCSVNCGGSLPQEFLTVKTPEPPELALLGIDLASVGALVLLFRRRRQRSQV